MKPIMHRVNRLRERFAGAIDRGSTSNVSTQMPNIYNQNANTSIVHGPGTIYNYNLTTNIVNSAVSQEADATRFKIATALQSRHVPQAVYNAHLSSGCMSGTRVKVLRMIEIWIQDLKASPIFWLAGMAGTGKTALAWTICSHANADSKIILGGSFFCSRSTSSIAQRDVRCIIPTLAQLMALQSSKFSKALAEELERDPGILHKQVAVQIEVLLYKPLLALKKSRTPILFVIDAIDECGGQISARDEAESRCIVSEMLEALVAFSKFPVKLPVKFLVTSRPETHIRDTPVSDSRFSTVLRLHAIDKEQVTADIRHYISTKLSSNPRLREKFKAEDFDRLAHICDGLFIVAATSLKYTLGAGLDVAEMRFETLLDSVQKSLSISAASPLDSMYALILTDATKTDGFQPEANKIAALQKLLASLLSARMTLSIATLADLLDLPIHRLRAHLSRLHAVVYVPDEDTEPGLRTLHASFGDYLFERAPDNVHIAKYLGHDVLARACLRRMARKDLCFNVSRARSSYQKNDPASVTQIAPSLLYACLHWAHHITTASDDSDFDLLVEQHFMPKFLFWLEVLSVLGKVGVASGLLRIAGVAVKREVVSWFLRDANSFVASSREAIERSVPHIYLSALLFAANDSLFYRRFVPLCTGLISAELFGIDRHGGQIAMTLTGHQNWVNSVFCSPNGHLLVSGSEDGTVRIWDTQTGHEVMAPLQSGDGPVNAVVFSPNGKSVGSGTQIGVVCIWTNLTSRPVAQRLSGHHSRVSSVAYSPDGSILASGSSDKTIRLWAAGTGESIAVLNGHDCFVKAIAFSSDGRTLASGSNDKTTRLWQVGSGESVVQSLVLREESRVPSVCFSSDGGMLASGISDGTIILRESLNWSKITTLRGHAGAVLSVQFSSERQSLVSASSDRSVRIWTLPQVVDEAISVVLTGHTDSVSCCTFSPDGLYIASASDDRTVRIWDASSGTQGVESLPAHDATILSAAVSPDGCFIVSGSYDNSVRVWNARTGDPILPPLLGHTSLVSAVAISCDGLMIASASSDHTVRLWKAQTGEPVGEPLRGHETPVRAVSFSPDGQALASGSDDGMVCIWNVSKEPPSIVQSLACRGAVYSVAFSPDGQLLAAGGAGRRIHLWQVATGQPVREALEIDSDAYSVNSSPSQTHIVSAEVGAVCVRIIATGERTLVLKSSPGPALSAAFSPNGHYICAGAGNDVRVWDAKLGTLIAALHAHTRWVRSVVFTPSGQSIVSCAGDRTIRVWDVEAACSQLPQARDDPISALTSFGLTNGWVLGPSGELLLWVPEEYRAYLYVPPCTTLIGSRRIVLAACKDGLHRGENWTKCWPTTKPTSLSHSM